MASTWTFGLLGEEAQESMTEHKEQFPPRTSSDSAGETKLMGMDNLQHRRQSRGPTLASHAQQPAGTAGYSTAEAAFEGATAASLVQKDFLAACKPVLDGPSTMPGTSHSGGWERH